MSPGCVNCRAEMFTVTPRSALVRLSELLRVAVQLLPVVTGVLPKYTLPWP